MEYQSIENCLTIIKKIIFKDPDEVSSQMDKLFNKDNLFIHSIAKSHYSLDQYHTSLKDNCLSDKAVALVLLKAENDLLAGYQILRLGYGLRSIYFIRLALESICQAILIFKDNLYYSDFLIEKPRTQPQKSIQKIKQMIPLKGLEVQINNDLKSLLKNKQLFDCYSHSTIDACKLDPTGELQTTFGGSYDATKEKIYRAIVEEFSKVCNIISHISEWMTKESAQKDSQYIPRNNNNEQESYE